MTVDSEAIFALVDELGPCSRGDGGAPRLDGRRPGSTSGCRTPSTSRAASAGRSGSAKRKHEAFFASTKAALEVVERYLSLRLRKRELPEGILVPLVDGRRQSGDALQARPRFRGDAPPGRARAGGGRVLPAPPRRDRRGPLTAPPATPPPHPRAAARARGTGTRPTRPCGASSMR